MAIEATGGLGSSGFLPNPGAGQQSPGAIQTGANPGDVNKPQESKEVAKLHLANRVQQGAEAKKDEVSPEDRIKQATQMLNDFMKHYAIELQFVIDDKQTITKVMNKQTGDVIRQIPSEEAIRLSKALDTLQGLIIQQKV